jgi:hypothetical protein
MLKNPRDVGVAKYMGRQVFGEKWRGFWQAYIQAINERPYGYLLLDLSQTCPDNYRVRSNIFPDEFPACLYVIKSG